jgi:hypothetical protein
VYISHGVYDEVLSIDRCSRRLLPQLKQLLPKVRDYNTSAVACTQLQVQLDGIKCRTNSITVARTEAQCIENPLLSALCRMGHAWWRSRLHACSRA